MAAPLIVLIPAFNEEARLPAVIGAVRALDRALELVVVDDGSRDATAGVARSLGATVLRHPFNLGYGAALQTGYKYALTRGTEVVVQMDADGQHKPSEIPVLLAPIEAGEADLVIGSRFLEPTAYDMGPLKSLGRKVFQGIGDLAGVKVTDPTSGFQALTRPVVELYSRDFFPADYPDVDVLMMAHRRGLRIAERSVEMLPSARESTLHGGMRTFYYVYKMLLSVFAAGSRTNQAKL